MMLYKHPKYATKQKIRKIIHADVISTQHLYSYNVRRMYNHIQIGKSLISAVLFIATQSVDYEIL